MDISLDDGTAVRLDTTVKLSGAVRTEKPEAQTLGLNTDDGQRAFPQGRFVSQRIDLLEELDITHENLGFSASGAAWYDAVYNQSNSNSSQATFNGTGASNQFSAPVSVIEGRDVELVNAFAHGDFHLGGLPLDVRVGRYALQWGEGIFTTDSVAYGMAPTDVIKATGVPGSQIKEIILPVAQSSFTLQVTSKISLEGYAQFQFRPDRFPAAGSYFELTDFLGAGNARILTGPNPFNPHVPLGLTQSNTAQGRDVGQFGLAMRFHPTTDLDVGLYFVEFDDKSPQIYTNVPVTIVPFAGAVPTAFLPQNIPHTAATGQLGTYTEGYARSIQIYGASASTSYGPINFGFEVSLRRNMDLESKSLSLGAGQTASFGDGALYPRGTTLHALANGLYIGETNRFWDGITVIGEISGSHLVSITANSQNFNPAYSRDEVGMTLVVDPEYFQVRPALDIDFPVTIGWNPHGNGAWNSTQNYSAFHGGYISSGISAVYQSVWRGGIQYTHFTGGSGAAGGGSVLDTPFLGRDFVSFNIQRSF
jgi:hypothetical protein